MVQKLTLLEKDFCLRFSESQIKCCLGQSPKMIPRMDEGRRRVDQRNKSEAVQMTQIRAEGLKAELMRNLLELESEILLS